MKQKNIDQYFESARQLPLAMSFEEVQALVKIKGGYSSGNQHSSWWNFKNFIFMTTAAIIIATTVGLFSSLNNTTETYSNVKTDSKETSIEIKNTPKEPVDENLENKIKSLPPTPLIKEVKTVAPKSVSPFLISTKKEPVLMAEQPFSKSQFTGFTWAKDSVKEEESSKIITKELDAKGIKWTQAFLFKGDIRVETWDQPKVKLQAYVYVETKTEEEKQQFLDDVKIELIAKGDKIEVVNECGDCNCSTTVIKGNKKNKSVKKSHLKKYRIDYVLTVPKTMNLDLKDNYGDITLPTMNSEVVINSFQGSFTAQKIKGKLKLTSKYGKVNVVGFEDGDLHLFQSKGSLGVAQHIELNAKYAKIKITAAKTIKVESFQSNIEIQESVKEIKGSFKYGDLILLKDAQTITLTVFQSKLNVPTITKLEIDGSYTTVHSANVQELILSKSFQNQFEIGELNNITGDDKYGVFEIGALGSSLELNLFQGRINIGNVLEKFNKLTIDSKYTTIDLNFNDKAKYTIDAQTTYASFNYPTQNMQIEYQKKEFNKFDIKGTFNPKSNRDASLVSLNSFQGKVNIK